MCGIFGYVGVPTDVGGAVLRALKRLEYRGYDSWGIAVAVNGHIAVCKTPGKIANAKVELPASDIGFGHTRWATHGGVTQANAHPHLDCTGGIAVVHNGIIENFRELRGELEQKRHVLVSETDSEVVVHLIEDEVREGQSTIEAFARVFSRLKGLGAVIVLDLGSRSILAAKRISPLVLGRATNGFTIASDETALADHATDSLILEDDQIAVLGRTGAELYRQADLLPVAMNWKPQRRTV